MIEKKIIGKDILYTFMFSALTMLFSIISYGIAGRVFSIEQFGEYMFLRRVVTLLVPIVMLGIPVALTRYLSINLNNFKDKYIITGTISIFMVLSIFCITLMVLPDQLGQYLLGISWERLSLSLILLLIGIVFHTHIFSIYRGLLQIRVANIMTVLNIGIIPFISIIIFKDVITVVNFIGVSIMLTSILISMKLILIDRVRINITKLEFSKINKEIFVYGFPRVPTFLISAILLSVSSIILARENDLEGVAGVNAGLNIIFIISSLLAPVGVVLLPRISQWVSDNRHEDIKNFSTNIIIAAFHIGAFILSIWIIGGSLIIEVWLGIQSKEIIAIAMIITIGIPFYAIYEVLRNILDAVTVRPINTINQSISFFVLVIVYFLFTNFDMNIRYSLAIATLLSVATLGILTLLGIKIVLKVRFKLTHYKHILFSSFLLIVIYLINSFVLNFMLNENIIMSFILFIIVAGVSFILFFILLLSMKVTWVCEVKRFFIGGER